MTSIELQRRLPVMPPRERVALERRARLLAWGGNAWHVVEFAVAIVAGVVAASPALIGFSLDSLIELAAGFVIIWLYRLRTGHADERRAQQLVAGRRVAGRDRDADTSSAVQPVAHASARASPA